MISRSAFSFQGGGWRGERGGHWNFHGHCPELYTALGSIVFPFMNPTCLPTYFGLNFLLQCFIIYSVQVSSSMVKFTPRYTVLLHVNVNGTVSLIAFSDCSPLVLLKHNWLHPTTLPNLFISSGDVLWIPFEFLNTWSCHLQIQFYCSFSNLDAFSFFLMSNSSGQNFQYYIK